MSFCSLLFIFVSVFLSVAAQILLKNGMSSKSVQASFGGDVISIFLAAFTNFYVIAGLTAYVASAGVWLFVLSKVDVSKAYPFVGLGFIGTMFFANWFLNEPLTNFKLMGTFLVLLGVFLISKS